MSNPDGSVSVTPTTLPVPTIAFYGDNLTGMSLGGGAGLTVQAGVLLSMTGNNSATIALTGTGNSVAVAGMLQSMGLNTAALSDSGSGSTITLMPGSAINAQTGATGAAILLAGSNATLTIGGSVQNLNQFSYGALLYPALIDRGHGSRVTVTPTGSLTGAVDLSQSDTRLRLDGMIAGSVTMGSNASLSGSGTVAGAVQGGTIQPGDPGSTTALTVGSLTGAGTTLAYDLTGPVAPLSVTTVASLTGGALVATRAPAAGTDVATVLQAGSVTGSFVSVTAPGRVAATANYGADTVQLATVSPALLDAETFAAQHSMLTQLDAVRGRLAGLPRDGGTPTTTNTASVEGGGGGLDAMGNALAAAPLSVSGTKGTVWGRGFYEGGHLGGADGVSPFTAGGGGFLLGADTTITDAVTVGGAFGYDHLITGRMGAGDRFEGSAYYGTLYGAWTGKSLFVHGALLMGAGDDSLTRSTSLAGATLLSQAHPTDWRLGAELTAGKVIPVHGFDIVPNLGLSYLRVDQPAVTDSGAGAFNLSTGDRTPELLRIRAGVDLDHTSTAGGRTVRTDLRLAYAHDSMLGGQTATAAFAGFGSPFALIGNGHDTDSAVIGLGAQVKIDSGLSLAADFEEDVSSAFSTRWFMGTVRYAF